MGWGPQGNLRATGWNASWWVVFPQSSFVNTALQTLGLWLNLCVGVCRQRLSSLPQCPSGLFLWASWESEVSGKSWEGRQCQHCWSVSVALLCLCTGCSSSLLFLYDMVPFFLIKRSCCSVQLLNIKIWEWVGKYLVSVHPELLLNCVGGRAEGIYVDRELCNVWNHRHSNQIKWLRGECH